MITLIITTEIRFCGSVKKYCRKKIHQTPFLCLKETKENRCGQTLSMVRITIANDPFAYKGVLFPLIK